MKPYLQYSTASLLLLLLIGSIYAYQAPSSKNPSSGKLSPELEKQKKAALALGNEGAWEAAVAAFTTIQQECIQQGFTEQATDIYEELFSVIVLRDDLEAAPKLQLLAKYQEAEKNNAFFQPLYHAALAHYYLYYEQLDSSLYYYEQASKKYQIQQRFKLEASLNLVLANEWIFLDDLQTASVYLKKAEQIVNKHKIELPIIYNIQSIVYMGLGDFDKALVSALKSIEFVEKDAAINPIDLSVEYNNLASVYSSLQDNNNALIYYQKAIKLIEPTGHSDIITYLHNVGATYLMQKKYKEATSMFLESISYLNKQQEKAPEQLSSYINNYIQLAHCYLNFGMLDSMLYYTQQAEKINKTYPYRIASTYTRYGEYYAATKDYPKADNYYKQALQKAIEAYGAKGEFVSGVYISLIEFELQQNNLPQALIYCQKALESISIKFSDEQGISNPKLENVSQLGMLIRILEKKLVVLKELYDSRNDTIKPSDIFESAKLATECMEQINRSMKNMDSKRDWLNNNAIPLFEEGIELALGIAQKTKDNSYLNEAFMLCEHSKSMLMADANQESSAANLGGVPDSLLEKSKTLQQVLALAEKKRFDASLMGDVDAEKVQQDLIFGYKHELDGLKHIFEQEYPKYYALKYESNVASIQDVQKILDESTSFIEYFEGVNNLYVFSIHQKTAHVEVVAKEKDFQSKMYDFQLLLTNIKRFLDKPVVVYNQFVATSSDLYDTFLKKSLKEGSKRLIIVPDGQLNYLPFEALLTNKAAALDQKSKEANFAKLPYLLNDYIVSYNYSATSLIAQQATKKQESNTQASLGTSGNILALAPSYAATETPSWRGEREIGLRKNLIELPGAAEEVFKLEQLFQGSFFIGTEANEALFKEKAPQHGILHLAMHGLVDKNNPEFSGLALSEDQHKTEDNFLYAYEIKQLALNSNLVVLSACETGIGKYQRGEGVVSIGRGFMYAGAPALLMTLWSLNDQSGALIIEYFYKNLSIGMQKDAAIRQAKLDYLSQCTPTAAHPFLWAAFIQVGDYSSIPINTKSSWWLYGLGGVGSVLALGFVGIKMRKKEDYV